MLIWKSVIGLIVLTFLIMDKIIEFLKKLPKGARIVSSVLLAVLMGLALFFSSSCSMVRATLDGTGKLSTSVNQSVADSVNISVHFNR